MAEGLLHNRPCCCCKSQWVQELAQNSYYQHGPHEQFHRKANKSWALRQHRPHEGICQGMQILPTITMASFSIAVQIPHL